MVRLLGPHLPLGRGLAGRIARDLVDEEEHLPCDIAIAFGSGFVIEVDGRYLHSTTDADSPASAAALHALINAETDERQQIQNGIDAGNRYDAIAGDISNTKWLTQ